MAGLYSPQMDEDFNPAIISKTNEQPDKYLRLVAVIISYLDDSTKQLPQIYAVQQHQPSLLTVHYSSAAQRRAGGLEAIMTTGPPAIERLTNPTNLCG